MKLSIAAGLLLLGCALTHVAGWAQNYPNKLIRIVVPIAPGGGQDFVARTLSQKLTEAWGQPVIVDNRPGGTGAVGSVFVARSPADGYTLLIVTASTHAVAPALQSSMAYDPVKDFAPISLILTGPLVLTIHPSVPARSVAELVNLAKLRPGSLNYATAGQGSLGHMAAELFRLETGTKIVHVPYKGAGAAVVDLLSGYVQLMFAGPPSILPQVRAGRLRALAVTGSKRVAELKGVPTFAEAGYSTVKADQWYGIVTTAGTPASVVDKLNQEIVRIMNSSDTKARFAEQGFYPESSTPQRFGQIIRDDLERWQKVAKASGMLSAN